MSLRVIPVTLELANDYVRRNHRHHRPVTGHKFSVGVARIDGEAKFICGVAIMSRPVAPRLDDGYTLEVTRCCTDGTPNACSMLYGACRRAGKALGYDRIFTYTLPEEGGASLRAAGYQLDKTDAGGPAIWWHSRNGRSATPVGRDLVGGKWRWVA